LVTRNSLLLAARHGAKLVLTGPPGSRTDLPGLSLQVSTCYTATVDHPNLTAAHR
jgi:hypothetical protein